MPHLAPPWNQPHDHHYTVEVVAARRYLTTGLVVDTDVLDQIWTDLGLARDGHIVNLNDLFGEFGTSVEWLSTELFQKFKTKVKEIVEVTVWEDNNRWGSAAGEVS